MDQLRHLHVICRVCETLYKPCRFQIFMFSIVTKPYRLVGSNIRMPLALLLVNVLLMADGRASWPTLALSVQ